MLSWLAYSETIGIPTANPAYLDLAVVRVAFGLEMGLSIAQSLTELQGGAFRLEIDGDLFKARVALPVPPEPPSALPE